MNNEKEQNNLNSELSFLTEFELSRKGMLKEIKTEFDIIRLCITQLNKIDKKFFPAIDRILVMPLRKLLCDKEPVLLKIEPNFKLPPFICKTIDTTDKLKFNFPFFKVVNQNEWIPINEWLEQKIAWFDKTVSDLPDSIPKATYKKILNFLKGNDKKEFESLFKLNDNTVDESSEKVYTRIEPDDEAKNKIIFSFLKEVGYYDLTVYTFIKHLSDKRGAHIDTGFAPLINILNRPVEHNYSIASVMAIFVICSAKTQIPELAEYWTEFDHCI